MENVRSGMSRTFTECEGKNVCIVLASARKAVRARHPNGRNKKWVQNPMSGKVSFVS